MESALGYLYGNAHEGDDRCNSCKKDLGPYMLYVTMDGIAKGSCMNCHYGSGAAGCSFRPGKDSGKYSLYECEQIRTNSYEQVSDRNALDELFLKRAIIKRFVPFRQIPGKQSVSASLELVCFRTTTNDSLQRCSPTTRPSKATILTILNGLVQIRSSSLKYVRNLTKNNNPP